MLDIFNQDAFSVVALTDAINEVPFVPGRAGALVNWNEESVAVTTVAIESRGSVLSLVNPTRRGGPGQTKGKDKRKLRNLTIPHYQVDDAVYAEEVQGVRAFGNETSMQQVEELVNRRLAGIVRESLDPTLEYQRIGALKGTILNADGTTLYNLFTEFGVTQETEVAFDLSAASPAAGILRERCDDIDRTVAENLGGIPYDGIHAFCGKDFWKDLIAHPEVREVYLASQTLATALLNPMAYKTIKIGNITFEEYRGKNGSDPFIHTDKAHFFPTGVEGLYRTVYAPADYMETVNTLGKPRYSKQFPMSNGKGVNLDVQMNALSYCTRPKTLMIGKRGA